MKTRLFSYLGMVMSTVQISAQTVTDFDGNEYETVEIGNQVWMAENLNSLHYPDGTAITDVWTYNNNEDTAAIYGRLYSWEAAVRGTVDIGGLGDGIYVVKLISSGVIYSGKLVIR